MNKKNCATFNSVHIYKHNMDYGYSYKCSHVAIVRLGPSEECVGTIANMYEHDCWAYTPYICDDVTRHTGIILHSSVGRRCACSSSKEHRTHISI